MSYSTKLSTRQKWILASRPKTLPAATAPVIVAGALSFADGHFSLLPFLTCLIAALLLQIGSNLANDVFDYEKGADSGDRLGPMRVTQAGLLTPKEVKRGMGLVFGLTALLGVYLIFIGGWPILVLGVAAILSAIAYTGGPYPLGYHGLGDVFVFIFFGLAATAGTYYLQAGEVTPVVWWMSTAMGFLTVNILVVNNLRDIENDRRVGKKTLAVRLGRKGAIFEYAILLAGSYAIPLVLGIFGFLSPLGLLTWVSLPLGVRWFRFIIQNSGKSLNSALAGSGQLELIYALLFALGSVIEGMT